MAVQKGRDFLLKLGTAAAGSTIAGMKTTSFTVNGEAVDATSKDSGGNRTLLAGAGTTAVSVAATGLLTGSSQSTTLLGYALDKSLNTYALIFDNGDTVEGSFQLTKFEAAGDFNKEQTYSIALESSGAVTVTPAS
ncbi:MAG: hypothetical protein HYU60_00020 [Magnetospirillum sp.]|nr:hypothetical protein [Magnetospirillum sp.]